MTNERVQIAWFEDLAGKMVACGDRVAVAVASNYYDGLRLGTVLEITGIWNADKGKYGDIRAKVEVDKATGLVGAKYNREAGQWETKPYFKTYDIAKRIVRID
jgi:hypothetical protein